MHERTPSQYIKMSARIAACLIVAMICAGCKTESVENEHPLGKAHLAISGSIEAQQEFDRALILLHHMTYPQAKIAFEHVAELDPRCAMAQWGIAMTLFQPLWPTRPGPEELQEGWEAMQRVKALAPPTESEQLFIAATQAFFLGSDRGYWERIHSWEQAMEELYHKLPDDPEVKAFYALACLATAQTSTNPLEHHNRAAEILLSILKDNPIHPGAIHYLIHANDIQGREHESLDLVRSYGNIAPRNPHALHMPTHIFTRLGSWPEVISWNIKAADAALEYPAGDKGQFVWDEFPHAVEYLIYGYLQQGDDDAAGVQLKRLFSTQNLHPTFKTAFHLSSIPVRYALERGDWQEAVDLVPRPDNPLERDRFFIKSLGVSGSCIPALTWDLFPWPEAVTWFAKGVGAAHLGRLEDAQRARDHLQVLEEVANKTGEELFTQQIRIMRLTVSAWTAHLHGQEEQALKQMQQAAELETNTPKHPVTPAPALPAYELLGDLLMELKKPGEALTAYERSLKLYPKRLNSLLGAARAARALEERQTAKEYYAALLTISASGSKRAGVQEAHKYVDSDVAQKE